MAELIQAIKFKCELVEQNYMVVVDLALQDYGEVVGENLELDQFNTGASEAVRPFLNDVLEFISDLHVLAKLKVFALNKLRIGNLPGFRNRRTATEWVAISRRVWPRYWHSK